MDSWNSFFFFNSFIGNLTHNLISTEKISESPVKWISWEIFSYQCTNLGIIQNHFITCLFIKANYSACMCAKLIQLCLTLCNPMDCSPPGSSVHGILQTRILEWVAMPSSRGSSWPRDWACVSCGSCIAGGFFIPSHWGSPNYSQN